MGARSREKAEKAIADIKVQVPEADITFLELDLLDLSSVKQAAEHFLAESSKLDILVNNAGVLSAITGLTKDGFELQFGTNHVGHALFTKLLIPVLQKTAELPDSDVRVVNVSSRAHKWAPKGGINFEAALTPMSNFSTMTRYGHSKLANIHFTQELAKRYPSIKSVTLHPGDVSTNMTHSIRDSFPWLPEFVWSFAIRVSTVSVVDGALNQLWAACSPDAKSGEYYVPVGKLGAGAANVNDKENAAKLWEWTEAQLRERGF